MEGPGLSRKNRDGLGGRPGMSQRTTDTVIEVELLLASCATTGMSVVPLRREVSPDVQPPPETLMTSPAMVTCRCVPGLLSTVPLSAAFVAVR